jgi:hypothetical protein
VNEKEIDPAHVQIRPTKEEGAIAVIDGMCFGAPRSEYCLEKLGSATEEAGINAYLVAEARTTTVQAECKR